MPRTPIFVTALLAFSAVQAGAQQYTWNGMRPDAVGPAGVLGDRVLGQGVIEVTAAFTSNGHEGVRFGSDFLSFEDVFDLDFAVAPLSLGTEVLELQAAFGVQDNLTVIVRTAWMNKSRTQLTNSLEFFELESSGISDTEAHVLYELFNSGGVRAHVQGGLIVPTGSVDAEGAVVGVRTGVLPYDMQLGGGVFGFMPGLTVQSQNDAGTVGAQIVGRIYVGENDRGWAPGNAIEANAWAAVHLNDYFSASARLRAVGWGAIEGFDADLDPFRDPGELPVSFGGELIQIPIGLNVYMPHGVLAGHRLTVEWISTAHESLDGPWLAADNGFVISWQKAFYR
jgi:hypothetical protein